MKKNFIGFTVSGSDSNTQIDAPMSTDVNTEPKKSVVDIYFPQRNMTLTYYNDRFDLHKGDIVYVDGKLEGKQGRVISVNYSFKIKLSDYKRVIAIVDTRVKGDFYLAGSHIVTFDCGAMPYEKVFPWFKAPDKEDTKYAVGKGGSSFTLDELNMDIKSEIAQRGHDYYMNNKVLYISVDKTHGKAIVEGSEIYEIEFDYCDGIISNLVCSCFCSYCCKHEFAAMLQLRETLNFIDKNYCTEYSGYFAAMFKGTFLSFAVNGKDIGKITLD